MKKRVLIVILFLAVAVGVGAVVYWALTPTPGVTVENFKRLHVGMTKSEIEAILGQAAEPIRDASPELLESLRPRHFYQWVGPDFFILISFAKVHTLGTGSSVYTVVPCEEATGGGLLRENQPELTLANPAPPLIRRIQCWFGL